MSIAHNRGALSKTKKKIKFTHVPWQSKTKRRKRISETRTRVGKDLEGKGIGQRRDIGKGGGGLGGLLDETDSLLKCSFMRE